MATHTNRLMPLNAAALIAVVGVAYFLGIHDLDFYLCSHMVTTSLLLGIVLLMVQAYVSRRKEMAAIPYITGYVLLFVCLDPICYVGKVPQARIIPILFLIPIVWGGACFLPKGYWLAGIGICLVLFSAVLALTYNIREGDAGGVCLLGGGWVRV
jgi:hypothetical protein